MPQTSLPQTETAYALFSAFIGLYYLVVAYYGVGPENWPRLIAQARAQLMPDADVSWQQLRRCRWLDPSAMLEVHA